MNFKEALVEHLNGKFVQGKGMATGYNWVDFTELSKTVRIEQVSENFASDYEFRVKPPSIIVNGQEVPCPETTEPEKETPYYYPCFDDGIGVVSSFKWTGDKIDNLLFKNGLVYLNADDCELRSKAMLKQYTSSTPVSVKDLKHYAPEGLPSYYDLMMAFMDFCDGQSDHDIPAQIGYDYDSDEVQRIIKTRSALYNIWRGEIQ